MDVLKPKFSEEDDDDDDEPELSVIIITTTHTCKYPTVEEKNNLLMTEALEVIN